MSSDRRDARTEDDGLDRRRAGNSTSNAPITVTNDDATIAHLVELGIDEPKASVLPRNFHVATSHEDFVFEEVTSTIRKLGRQAGLTIDVPGPSSYRSLHEKDYEIIVPVMQFAHAFLLEGGATLTVTFLEHLAHYIASQWGAKTTQSREFVCEFVVTRSKCAKRLTYRGPVEGLASVVEVACKVFTENEDDR